MGSICHTVISLPGRFQAWSIRQQKQQDVIVRNLDVDVTNTKNEIDIDSNGKRTGKRAPLFSRFKPSPKPNLNQSSSGNRKMNHNEEQSSNYSVSNSVMPDLTVIMEDVILDNNDEDKINELEDKINQLEEAIDQDQSRRRNFRRRRSSA